MIDKSTVIPKVAQFSKAPPGEPVREQGALDTIEEATGFGDRKKTPLHGSQKMPCLDYTHCISGCRTQQASVGGSTGAALGCRDREEADVRVRGGVRV